MSLLDSLANQLSSKASNAINSGVRKASKALSETVSKGANKALTNLSLSKKSFKFDAIPETVEQFKALDEFSKLKDPYATAALTVVAFAAYAQNPEEGVKMFNALRGPEPLSNHDIELTHDCLMNDKEYIPLSYFEGATVENNYTPKTPYEVKVYEGAHSNDSLKEGYMKLFVQSSGADSQRHITLRTKKSTGEWFLHDHAAILMSIRVPKAADPWA